MGEGQEPRLLFLVQGNTSQLPPGVGQQLLQTSDLMTGSSAQAYSLSNTLQPRGPSAQNSRKNSRHDQNRDKLPAQLLMRPLKHYVEPGYGMKHI